MHKRAKVFMMKQEKLRSTVKGHIIPDKLFYYAAENKGFYRILSIGFRIVL